MREKRRSRGQRNEVSVRSLMENVSGEEFLEGLAGVQIVCGFSDDADGEVLPPGQVRRKGPAGE